MRSSTACSPKASGAPVHHVQLPGGRHDRRRSAAQAPAEDSGALSRYRLSLLRNIRLSRPDDEGLGSESAESRREAIGRRPGSAIRNPQSHRSRPLLPAAQSRAAFFGARELRHLVHGAAPRAVAHAQESESRRAPRAAERQNAAESEPSRRVDAGIRCGITPARTASIIFRYTISAIPASAASPAPRFPPPGADARSGRWGGRKLECGIHTESKRADE